MTTRLDITFEDERRSLHGGELLFGRTADLEIGAGNQFVHRTMGRFMYLNGCWWIENRAEHLPLTITSVDGSRVELAARSATGERALAALVSPSFTVRFAAGGVGYEIEGELPTSLPVPESVHHGAEGEDTVHAIRLTDDERLLLTALARPVLLDPAAGPDALPANKTVARQLGWPDTKLNRKLDYLCTRLTKQGFQGLKGGLGGEARLRRWRLVEYAISHGLVDQRDLDDD